MNKILRVIFGVIIVAGLGALIFFNNQKKADDPNVNIDASSFDYKSIIAADNLPDNFTGDPAIVVDHIDGKADSDVVMIEWQNYQCSACYSLSPSMREIYDTYKDRVAFVYRYLYLTGHPNGMAASVAAEAARNQGKFHTMNDLLFEEYAEWTEADASKREDVFAKYAEKIGLNMDQWRQDYKTYDKTNIKKRLDFQDSLGRDAFKKTNISGYTPFIIINGEVISSSDTKNNVIKALDAALAK